MYRLLKILILLFFYTGQVSLAQSVVRAKKAATRTKARATAKAGVSTPLDPSLQMPTGPLTGVPSPMITPTYCPPGVLPQYCQQQTGFPSPATCGVIPNTSGCVPSYSPPTTAYPYGCMINTYQCQATQYQMAAGGCTSGLMGMHCGSTPWTETLQQQMNPQPQQNMMPSQQQNPMMPLLNALSGNPSGTPAASAMNSAGGYMGGDRIASGGDGGGGYGGGGGVGPPAGVYITTDQLTPYSSRGYASIVPPVKQWFDVCTQKLGLGKCAFRNDGIWGDASHMARHSCHNSGQAMDIGTPLHCSTGGFVGSDDSRAMQVAFCLADQTGNTFGVIYHDVSHPPNMGPAGVRGKHHDHIHVKVRSCPY